MKRRDFLFTACSAAVLAAPVRAAAAQMQVLKSPTCGCCSAWVTHIKDTGLVVETRDVSQEVLWAAKDKAGISPELSSCHTGIIEGYVIEGHVPASDIQRLLAERPDAIGLTVPGMPIGSPGMEMGDQRDALTRCLFCAMATRWCLQAIPRLNRIRSLQISTRPKPQTGVAG